MQSDLKMCPFCGGDGEYHSDKGPTGEVYAWVGCNQCDAMSVHCDVRSMQPEETHPIDAWNTRASDTELTRLAEALRAAEEREKALREERDELLSQISDCRGSHWLGRQDRKGVTPHLDAIWRGLVEVDGARQALAGAKP